MCRMTLTATGLPRSSMASAAHSAGNSFWSFSMRSAFFFLSFIITVAARAAVQQDLPSADDVVAKMMERDNQRQAALHGYTAVRRYVLENSRHHKRAEMLV